MSDQSKRLEQKTSTSEEMRQQVLDYLDATKKAIEELDEQQLEAVAGFHYSE